MRARRAKLDLDEYDRNIVIRALNEMRNELIEERQTTDAVDDLMIRIHHAGERMPGIREARTDEWYR